MYTALRQVKVRTLFVEHVKSYVRWIKLSVVDYKKNQQQHNTDGSFQFLVQFENISSEEKLVI